VLAAGCSSRLPACLKVFALYNWPDRALVGSYVDNSLLCREKIGAEQSKQSELKGSFRFSQRTESRQKSAPCLTTGSNWGADRLFSRFRSTSRTCRSQDRRRFRSSSTTGEELRKARETRDRREEGGVRGSAALSCCYSLSWL
jgi:hypothetical protein